MSRADHYTYALGWTIDPVLPDERRQHHAPIYDIDDEAQAIHLAEQILQSERERVPKGSVILATLFREKEVVRNFPEFRK